MHELIDLRGRNALITGGAKRIGAAIAVRLAREQVNIAIHYQSSQTEAEALAAQLLDAGVRAVTVQGDLSQAGVATRVFEDAIGALGPIDFLVNNASIFPRDTFAELDAARLGLHMQLHAIAPLELGRALHAQGREGAIVNLLDARIHDYDKLHLAYHLSKKTLASLTRIMALELAPRIRVNAVSPGLALPPEGKDMAYLVQLAHTNPLQRHGSADGVAEAVYFLLRSGFITGENIHVDGGRNLHGNFYG